MTRGAHRPHRLGVVVNPTAGQGRAARAGRVVVDALRAAGHDVRDLSAPTAALALERARAAAGADGTHGRVDALVVVGGDGMVHLGAQAVAGTATPLGVVAAGTGNDFARALGLPVGDARSACTGLLAALDAGPGGVRPVDAARVTSPDVSTTATGVTAAGGGRWVAGAVSAGLDAAVNARANAMRRPHGRARYVLAAVAELARYRPWSYRLTFAGVEPPAPLPGAVAAPGDPAVLTWTGRAALVTAANCPRIGGGIRVAPHARTDDGLLDVVVAAGMSAPGAAVAFGALLCGVHLRHPRVHLVRARGVLIEPGPDAPTPDHGPPAAFGDGERLGPLPLRVDARPGALRVLSVRPVPD